MTKGLLYGCLFYSIILQKGIITIYSLRSLLCLVRFAEVK